MNRLRLGDGPAVDCAQEVVEEALTRRRVVEHVADESGARGLLDEVAQSLRGGPEAFEEEGVDGCVARRELRGVQVPALVEGVCERVLYVVVVKFPRALDGAPVLLLLLLCERAGGGRAVRGDGHDVGRAVGEPDARAAQGDLDRVAREVTGRVRHVLVRGCYLTARSVVIRAEVRRRAAAPRGFEKDGQMRLSALVDD